MRRSVYVTRLGMIGFWVLLIVLFLCLPYLAQFIRTEKSINVMTWTELIDPKIIKEFEQQAGIKVNLSYFEDNEELYARVRATKARGYDILIPSDYIIEQLVEHDLLKRIDKTKLTMWHRLDPKLLGQYYDPKNKYSIPYFWALYGLGIDIDAFGGVVPESSWGLLFDKTQVKDCVVMPDAIREVILIAAQYLYKTIDNLDEQKTENIYRLLIQQKQWVAAYSEMRADFLLTTGVCPVIVSQSPLMWPIMQEYKNFKFLVPKEGTFVVIDNIVIPKATQKDEYVYAFINFLYQSHVIRHHFNTYRFFPATTDLLPLLDAASGAESIKEAHHALPKKLEFFRNVLTEKIMNEIWIALKGF